ncbi:LptF/LptG family permease [Rhodocaloribacter litoris]|uniref:LptF/LptG family permease n=1 Tax=Rhodocaloribacter litoris TaxID=2558931 RepID=UPI0014235DA8|nr:LptF/LptG family permease [Rhodocaloribacter litoris]QXD15680.1 LptF/LptG family permease [Rhodocaloribacter litoris]
MTTFDRHIIRRLVQGYAFLVGALIVFFIVLHYVESIDDFMDRGATMRDVFLVYYVNYIPEIVRLTSPLALFLACVYLTGKLAQQLQLAALQTSGVSLYRLLCPYVLVALCVTGFMVWFNGFVVPRTNQVVLAFEQKYLKDAPRQLDLNDIHRQNRPGSFVTVGYFDRETNKAFRVSLEHFEGGRRLASRIDAHEMSWIDSLGLWRLSEPVVRTFTPDGREIRRTVARIDTLLQLYPRDLARTERDVESMTIPVAAEYVDQLRRSGASNIGRPLVGYYTKFSYPFANLILILIGVPLSAVRRRGGQAVRIGLGLLTAFSYLAVQKLVEPFGYAGQLEPALAAWLPHALFFGLAMGLLWHVRK